MFLFYFHTSYRIPKTYENMLEMGLLILFLQDISQSAFKMAY